MTGNVSLPLLHILLEQQSKGVFMQVFILKTWSGCSTKQRVDVETGVFCVIALYEWYYHAIQS